MFPASTSTPTPPARYVVPPGQLDEVLAEARRIEADDARFRAEIAREDLTGPVAGGGGRGQER